MNNYVPQVIYLILIFSSVAVTVFKLCKNNGSVSDVIATGISAGIVIGLLSWGGFFSRMF